MCVQTIDLYFYDGTNLVAILSKQWRAGTYARVESVLLIFTTMLYMIYVWHLCHEGEAVS